MLNCAYLRTLFVLAASGSVGWADEPRVTGELHAPVRLEAEGKVIDSGPRWGHSSPCLEDLDGDGLPELIVGDFSGKFRSYKNVGTPGSPKFGASELIQAAGSPAEVRIYCCIGSQPRFGDLDGDGLRDMISNSYDPGHCYLFRRLPAHQFSAREEVVDKAGVPVRSTPVQKETYQSFGSFYELVDWDADGDLDMLIGCFGGDLKVRLNEGTAREARWADDNIAVRIGDKLLSVKAHFCPKVADWDGDGRWDIVAGCNDGSVILFRNTGEAKSPAFAPGVLLVAPHPATGYELVQWSEKEIVPGIRSQVEVADFNGDGKLDLIVGDFSTVYDFKPDLSEEQRSEVEAVIEKATASGKEVAAAMEALREDFKRRHSGDEIVSDAAQRQFQEEYEKLKTGPIFKAYEATEREAVKQIKPFLRSQYQPGDEGFSLPIPHGYVWLYVRK